MTRVLSGLVLFAVVLGTVAVPDPRATLLLACAAAVLAFLEYVSIAAALGARVPKLLGAAAVLAACVAVGARTAAAEVVLMSAVVALGATAVASGAPGPAILRDTAAAVLPVAYIGLPLGALAAVRAFGGRDVVAVLALAIAVSDSAQYYTGRAVGRRPLAAAISPKKTVEGAIGGVIAGTLALTIAGRFVFSSAVWLLALTGFAICLLGIVGDLFESLLKRGAGVKDSSHLIPGHGGVLDRIDSWLFAAPVYYVFVRFFSSPA